MQVEVNGTRLWFDVAGPSLEPDGSVMRERPTLLLIHGGPGSYDHSYFRPWFDRFADVAQVVYLDLRNHGRSAREDASDWSYERCADDVAAFCDSLGIALPVVLGHSMGGFVAMLYGARHPSHAGGLILLGTHARFDLDRLAEGFRVVGGDAVGALARRDYGGEEISEAEGARVYAAFGPNVPSADALARRIQNAGISARGPELMTRFDVVSQLARIDVPTLVVVGELDAVTPVGAAREIAAALRPGVGRLEVLPGAGHFSWLDTPEPLAQLLDGFVREVA